MNFLYYLKYFSYNALPSNYFKHHYKSIQNYRESIDPKSYADRIDYYCKINAQFSLDHSIPIIGNFKRSKGTGYYLDLKEFLHYFNANLKLKYRFGDDTDIPDLPTITKARLISPNNQNAVLFKLNKRRHFKWVKDDLNFQSKNNGLAWRGGAYQPNRKMFVKKFYDHKGWDIGQTNKPVENVPWQKPFLSIKEQLKYKFIFCPEGNDVATNLKWVMSSNSIAIMPKPKYETWFMEGTLIDKKHYIQVRDDLSDLEEKIDFYIQHPKEADYIIQESNLYVEQFKNDRLEELISFKTLEKYFKLSNQEHIYKFN